MTRTIIAADLFAGAGGASVGLRRACAALGLPFELVAVNHWPVAVATHRQNHPASVHLCEAVERVRPRDAVPGGRLDLLMAGPSCVHHSRARGGRPVNEQDRASAWCILRWVDELRVDTLLIENVPEFEAWGPVGASGKPLKRRRGAEFRAWVNALEAANYRVEWHVLNAANYGDATTRERLWIIARRNRARITWPEPTHSEDGLVHLFGARKRWVPARDIIDWSIPGRSIFARTKPLSPKTMARIIRGLELYGGPELQPYLVILRNNVDAMSLDRPAPTVCAGGEHVALVQPRPFVMHVTHGRDAGRVHDVGGPLPTVTGANRGELALIEPLLLQQQSGGVARPVSAPAPTIAARGAQAIVQACLVAGFGERDGQQPRVHGLDRPYPAVTASKGGPALVRAFLTHYYGSGGASSVEAPVPTATARDRFGLVMPVIDGVALDILFRMLQPHELAAAMSFDRDYRFSGNRGDQVRQIGNAWPCRTAEALVRQLLAERAARPAAQGREATA